MNCNHLNYNKITTILLLNNNFSHYTLLAQMLISEIRADSVSRFYHRTQYIHLDEMTCR